VQRYEIYFQPKGKPATAGQVAAVTEMGLGQVSAKLAYLRMAYTSTPTQLVFQINREPAFDALRDDETTALLSSLEIPE
jgi:hypothetical protein